MGCFLGCFGSSKDRNRNRNRHRVRAQPRDNRNGGFKQAQPNVFVAQKNPEVPSSDLLSGIRVKSEREKNPEVPSSDPVSEIGVMSERQLSSSPRKKVTFDSNVTTYEHVPVQESADFTEEKEKNLVKERQTQSTSEDSSITSSSGSYPSNHRYQNCWDSDDELDYGESDLDDDEEEEEDDGVLDYDDAYEDDEIGSMPVRVCSLPEKEAKLNPSARDRSGYVHSVLNPVENLTQWKAVKAKGTLPLKQQKENLSVNEEPLPTFQFGLKEKSDQQLKKSGNEIAVDASLSNWLGASESTPVNRASLTGLGTVITPEKCSVSTGSNSPKSFDERPILGALTVEEIKQFSAKNSPRKSPSRSPDDMPIIGTVGTYWNSGKDSGSASLFKRIPNTTC